MQSIDKGLSQYRCMTLHKIVVHASFPKHCFLITVQVANIDHMQAALPYDGWIWTACDVYRKEWGQFHRLRHVHVIPPPSFPSNYHFPLLFPFPCLNHPSSTHPILISQRTVNNRHGVVVLLGTHGHHQGTFGCYEGLEAVTRTW